MTEGQQRLHLFLLAVIVVFGFVLVVVIMSWGHQVPTLSGERVHDFETVDVGPERKERHHTFELTNETDKWIRILKIAPSCGCTEAEASVKDVEPGGQVSVITAMEPSSSSGLTKVRITLYLNWTEDPIAETQSQEILWLRMTTKRTPRLWTNDQVLVFHSVVDTLQVEVYSEEAEIGSGKEPPKLTAVDPEGLSLEINPWRQRKPSKESLERPALYSTRVTIKRLDKAATLPETIPIEFHAGDMSCTVTLDTVPDPTDEGVAPDPLESIPQPNVELAPQREPRLPLAPSNRGEKDTGE